MTNIADKNRNRMETFFLSERLMTAVCIFIAAMSLVNLARFGGDYLAVFEITAKLVISAMIYFAFRHYKWDVVKGLVGGMFFCLMYQEAYLVLGRMWGDEDFDTYLVAGVSGSIYLAASGMSLMMTIIITINHFIINYARRGNPENVIFNHMAIIFKFGVYAALLAANGGLGFPAAVLWDNALHYLTDMAVLLLLACIESQFDSFNVLRQELLEEKREREKADEPA
ncbi:MAG: hypothetical protein K6F73_03100 [Lachnospiraceae bacterium]|nr:hypothetical protein [Lachnospiraceae bacterium]